MIQETDNSTKILVTVDASNLAYSCCYNAVKYWQAYHKDEASLVLKDKYHTDQNNLPDLINYDSFRKAVSTSVQNFLEKINTILQNNFPNEIASATAIDVFFAFDSNINDNFRKKLYPEYKAQRTAIKLFFNVASVKNYILNVVFKELNIEAGLGYKFIKVSGCECDDIIATIMENYTGYLKRVIISTDRDFLQIDNVSQFNFWGQEIKRTISECTEEPLSKNDYLLWKIIFGDSSDNIKHVFPKYGKKKSFKLINDRNTLKQMLNESNDAAERFKLNMELIDFRRIPNEIKQKILVEIDNKLKNAPEVLDFNVDNCLIF